MPVFNNVLAGAAGQGGDDYKIERSLRFNSADNAYLSRTPSSIGNSSTWTYSCWVKRTKFGGYPRIFGTYDGSYIGWDIEFNNSDQIDIHYSSTGSNYPIRRTTTAKYRDPGAWMHVVVAADLTVTGDNSVRLWVNGLEVTEFDTKTNSSSITTTNINTATQHRIGYNYSYADFYLADVHLLDGIAISNPDGVFGEFDSVTGVWNPIEYTGSYSGAAVGSGVVYSAGVSTPQGLQSSNPAANAFDGSTSTAATTNTVNGSPTLTVTFNPPLTNVTSLRMYTGNIGSNQYATGYGLVNGTSISHSTLGASYGAGWVDFTGHFSGTTVNSMGLGQTNAGTYALGLSINAIEVNGTILQDGTPAGVNGFRLDFSDSSSTGALGDNRLFPDYSKLGGATTTTTGDGTFYYGHNSNRLFDGNTANQLFGSWVNTGDDSNVIWSPPSGSYSVSSSLRVYAGYYSTIYVNGVSKATGAEGSNSAWVTLNHTGAITSIKVENTVNDNVARIGGIEIDGTLLTSKAWTVNNLVAADDVSTSAVTNVGSATGTVYYSDNNNNAYDPANLTVFSSGQHSTTASNMRHVKIADLGTGSIALTHVSGNNFYITGSNTTTNTNSSPLVHSGYGAFTINSSFGYAYARIYAGGQGQITYNATVTGPTYPHLTTTNNNNYSSLAVGDSNAAGVSITAIDSSSSTITVDGGSWSNGAKFTKFNDSDSVLDSPTDYDADSGNNGGNFATLNPLATVSGLTLSNGNLEATGNVVQGCSLSTIFPSSGKYYAEFTLTTYHADTAVGVVSTDVDYKQDWVGEQTYTVGYLADGRLFQASSSTNIGAYAAGDTIGIAFDVDTGKIWFSKNGTFINSGNPGAGTGELKTISGGKPLGIAFRGVGAGAGILNFGARPFIHSPPTAFDAICTQNLPDPTIKDSSTAFDAHAYDGTGQAKTVSGLKLSPDMAWIKERDGTSWPRIIDAVRGQKEVFPNRNAQQASFSQGLNSFTSDGFTLGTGADSNVNTNNKDYIAWLWGGGSSFSNSAGSNGASVASSGRANTSAGFAVATFTSPASGDFSIAHGLNQAPEFVMVKTTGSSGDWTIFHKDVMSNTQQYLVLNNSNPLYTYNNIWGSGLPTSSVINMTSAGAVANGHTCVAYSFAPIDNFSAFGKYTGNSSQNFQHLGFQPRWIMIKNTSTSSYTAYTGWAMFDTERQPHNVNVNALWGNNSSDEGKRGNGSTASAPDFGIDIVSNGFTLRDNGASEINLNNETYVYAAFAEHPFKYARAR